MRVLGALVGLVLVVGVVVELLAPSFVEGRIEDQVRAVAQGVVGVEADVDSFPLVTRLLLTERVESVDVRLDEVATAQIPLARVSFGLRGVVIDRDRLLQGRIFVRDIQTGEIEATVTQQALSQVLGTALDLTGLEGLPAGVSLPTDLVPCTPQAAVENDVLVLTCSVGRLPALMARALQ